jgi:4-hydroxy-2-oxoheptanedioate aldolase
MRPEISLRSRLRAGESAAGCFVMVPSPAIVEMVGYAGFDFVVLDREHGAATTEMIEHQIRAADAAGISAIVRVPTGAPFEILHALDAGASGILVPHVQTGEGAEAIARAVHYPPFGVRGMATTTRAGRHGMVDMAEHLRRAADETLLMLQIEDAPALDHVRDIAAVEGVGAIFIGPADLAVSLGHPGRTDHPEVVAAFDRIVEDVRAVGKVALSSFARSAEEAARLKARGIDMICLSTTSILANALKQLGRDLGRS